MKALARNKQPFYYAKHQGISGIEKDGLFTGQYTVSYSEPVKAYMNISPASGQTILEQFGIHENYDKILVTDDMNCPIKEDDILWIDAVPVVGEETPNDYYVVRVAKSLNSIAIAVRKA